MRVKHDGQELELTECSWHLPDDYEGPLVVLPPNDEMLAHDCMGDESYLLDPKTWDRFRQLGVIDENDCLHLNKLK